jgi:hypothetical protein
MPTSSCVDVLQTASKPRPAARGDGAAAAREALQAYGHHRDAAAWATRGLVALFGSLADITEEDLDEDPDGALLAVDRMRARQAAGLPADHIDDLVIASAGDDDQL